MFAIIAENLGSLLVLLALGTVIGLILAVNIRNKKQGKSPCAGCSSCPMAGKCHKETTTTERKELQ